MASTVCVGKRATPAQRDVLLLRRPSPPLPTASCHLAPDSVADLRFRGHTVASRHGATQQRATEKREVRRSIPRPPPGVLCQWASPEVHSAVQGASPPSAPDLSPSAHGGGQGTTPGSSHTPPLTDNRPRRQGNGIEAHNTRAKTTNSKTIHSALASAAVPACRSDDIEGWCAPGSCPKRSPMRLRARDPQLRAIRPKPRRGVPRVA
jgi:hypothetical protein